MKSSMFLLSNRSQLKPMYLKCMFNLAYCIILRSWDSLRIRNKMNHNFGFYCGEKTGEEVLVTGQYAFMVFHSDASHEKRGFKMHFTPVPFGKYSSKIAVSKLYSLFHRESCFC